jgi:hypothetical protein
VAKKQLPLEMGKAMNEQFNVKHRNETRQLSIAEAINEGLKSLPTLVANYTAAVQTTQNLKAQKDSGSAGPSQDK